MLGLNLAVGRSKPLDVLCIGAHCDDIEIGCGATLLGIQKDYADCRIHWVVLCSTPERRAEAERAMRTFVRRKHRGLQWIGDFPDGYLPGHFSAAKEFLEQVARQIRPGIIFTTHQEDRHQDHRLVSEITFQTFRNHLVCEYEIPKFDGCLSTPNLYVPVSRSVADRKARALLELYGSQRDKHWFTEDTFRSLMRLRGIECRAAGGFAEAFHCRKLVLGDGRSSR